MTLAQRLVPNPQKEMHSLSPAWARLPHPVRTASYIKEVELATNRVRLRPGHLVFRGWCYALWLSSEPRFKINKQTKQNQIKKPNQTKPPPPLLGTFPQTPAQLALGEPCVVMGHSAWVPHNLESLRAGASCGGLTPVGKDE